MDSDAPPPPKPTPGLDDYERTYMQEGGTVRYRDKQRVGWPTHAIFGIPLVLVWILTLSGAGSKPAPLWLAPVFTVLFGLMWVNFMAIRTVITDTQLHIQFGLFGPKIPLASIELCQVSEYSLLKFGGYGIRRALDGTWAYYMGGDGGKVVEIHYRDKKGKLRKVVVGSDNTAALCRAIEVARAQKTEVRVAELTMDTTAPSRASLDPDDALEAAEDRAASGKRHRD